MRCKFEDWHVKDESSVLTSSLPWESPWQSGCPCGDSPWFCFFFFFEWGGGIRLEITFRFSRLYQFLHASWNRWCTWVVVSSSARVVWWETLDLSCLGRLIYAGQILCAKQPSQFHHRWAEKNHSDRYTNSKPFSRLPKSLVPSAKLRTVNLLVLHSLCDVVEYQTPASHTPSRGSNLRWSLRDYTTTPQNRRRCVFWNFMHTRFSVTKSKK